MVFLELWREVRFFSSYDGELREPLVLLQEVQSQFQLRGGARDCSQVTAGESGFNLLLSGNLEVFLEL